MYIYVVVLCTIATLYPIGYIFNVWHVLLLWPINCLASRADVCVLHSI